MKWGLLSPTEFIPAAEESGLIMEPGEWVLQEAGRFNKTLINLGYPTYIVSVNIFSIQINRAGFINLPDKALRGTGEILVPDWMLHFVEARNDISFAAGLRSQNCDAAAAASSCQFLRQRSS